jgi:uncharacterized protein YkwD
MRPYFSNTIFHSAVVSALSFFLAACGGGGGGSEVAGAPDVGASVSAPPTAGAASGSANSTPVATSSTFASCPQIKSPQAAMDAVNQARAVARTCGGQSFPAVAPLQWNDQLASAALAHSQDMAIRQFFDHNNPSGESPFDRTAKAGYGRFTGENIAAGYSSLDDVMNGWLSSAGHCANIMRKEYRDFSLACAVPTTSPSAYSIYWTQNFGSK